jgi:ElaB/YqjD/DUF883 family membrane-anchored ribosome-binding protein
MSGGSERVFEDLQKIMNEVEDLVKATLGTAGERAGGAAERLQAGIGQVRDRLAAFEQGLGREFKQGARLADRYVHDNAWLAVGVAAAAAFLLGVFAARRD